GGPAGSECRPRDSKSGNRCDGLAVESDPDRRFSEPASAEYDAQRISGLSLRVGDPPSRIWEGSRRNPLLHRLRAGTRRTGPFVDGRHGAIVLWSPARPCILPPPAF